MAALNALLLQSAPWSELIMANHALVRAMIEAETMVVTTYPGSPTPEIADAILSIPSAQRPFYFEYATNEKVALEVAYGASMNGHLAAVFFKSVGLNVAADSAVQLPLMDLAGGMVVILGDDPGANSSQNEQDNRHFARMSLMPMLEPASPAETYHMYLEAARIARTRRMPVLLRLTTHVCHQREVVHFGARPDNEPDWTPRFSARDGEHIPITQAVFPMKARALQRLREVAIEAAHSPWNSVLTPNGSAPIGGLRHGIIAAGLPAMACLEHLERAGHPIDLFKLGYTFPLPGQSLLDFLSQHDEILVLEELDRVLEQEIKAFAYDHRLRCRILARQDSHLSGELDLAAVAQVLADAWPSLFTEPAPSATPGAAAITPRVPTFCPGCGHRAAFYAVRAALPEGAITVADIGCHTMGAFAPYRLGQALLSMGHSTATGAGLALGNTSRKVVAFVGDSTFYHAAMPAIVNAVHNDHNLTLVVMENGATAMTGQQTNPSSPEAERKIPIQQVLEGLGVSFIRKVDCYQHDKLVAALQEAFGQPGFSVVIASHPCMLKFTRALRRKGRELPMIMTIDPKADAATHARISAFDCPSFQVGADGRTTVHPGLCIGDGSCKAASPEGALILRKRKEVLP